MCFLFYNSSLHPPGAQTRADGSRNSISLPSKSQTSLNIKPDSALRTHTCCCIWMPSGADGLMQMSHHDVLVSCAFCLTTTPTCQVMTGRNDVRQSIARRIAHDIHACFACFWLLPICQSACILLVPSQVPSCVDIVLLSFDCALDVSWSALPCHGSLRAFRAAGSSPDVCIASDPALADFLAISPGPSPGFLQFGLSNGSSDVASMPMCFAGGSSASLLLSQYLWRPPD